MTSTPPVDPQESSSFDPADPPLWAPHYRCSPGDAVRRFFRKYADFTGRASRSEYWWWQLVSLVGGLALYLLALLAGIPGTDSAGPGPGRFVGVGVAALCLLAIVVPHITLTVRRLHDVNLSGLLVILGLIPYVGWLIMLVIALLPPIPQGARFDDPWYRITREGYSTTHTLDPTRE
ncbi:MAG: DUF805 domain-containing protein [Streptosporangiales bacterium]|nr:DUF805 domain-containing protein [Streptosporangiales bacterium]